MLGNPTANRAPRRRELLFYTHALVGGGAERVWARLASGFAARGDRVVFAVDSEARESLLLLSKEVELEVLPRGHAGATLGLARLIAAQRPSASLSAISVSNLKHAVAANMARRGDRAILSYHGFFDSEPERLSRLGYRLTPLLARATAATVAVSNGLRQNLLVAFRAPAANTVTIYNPASPEPFPASLDAAALAAREPLVVAIGRLVPDKDFVTLLRAFARLANPEARLIILGEGPERARLEGEVRARGLESRVTMPGFVSDPGEVLADASCFVISSRLESFSLVCVEALAHGLPVVTTDCAGPTEIINAPELGIVTPVGDVEEMARAIEARLADPGEPAPRQARARDFTLLRALDRYDQLIESVITHARSPA
jgi:glycosyltransferase involved in cell wall biosynthesis